MKRAVQFACVIAACAAGAGAAGCQDAIKTQTVVRFFADAQLTVPSGTMLHVVLYRDGERQHESGQDLGTVPFEDDTPLVVTADQGDSARRFTVFAELLDAGGQRLSWSRVRTGFVQDELSEVRVHFATDCPPPADRAEQAQGFDGVIICPSHDTCRPGADGAGVCDGPCVDPEPYRVTAIADPTAEGPCPNQDCAVVDAIDLGWQSTCARVQGELFCWGEISFGGEGRFPRPARVMNGALRSTPDVEIVEFDTVVRHTCALDVLGRVHCGGDSQNHSATASRLADGNSGVDYRPCCSVPATPAPPPMIRLDADAHTTCGLTLELGEIWCSGAGRGAITEDTGSFTRARDEGGFEEIWTMRDALCGLRGGDLECWGPEDPLPNGEAIDVTDYRSISTGRNAMCLVTATGELRCYGETVDRRDYATNPVTLGSGWRLVAMPEHGSRSSTEPATNPARHGHRCAIREDGTLWCWGENGADDPRGAGAAGVDPAVATFIPEDAPLQVGQAADWTDIAVGYQHSCGIREGGRLWCWGRDANGQLGGGQSGHEPQPICVPNW